MYSQEVVKATKVAEEMVQPEASSTLRAGGGATDIFNSCVKPYDKQNSLLLAIISPWKRGDLERSTSKKTEKRLEMPAVKTFASIINKIKYVFVTVHQQTFGSLLIHPGTVSCVDQIHSSLQLSKFNCSAEGKKVIFPLTWPSQNSTLEHLVQPGMVAHLQSTQ